MSLSVHDTCHHKCVASGACAFGKQGPRCGVPHGSGCYPADIIVHSCYHIIDDCFMAPRRRTIAGTIFKRRGKAISRRAYKCKLCSRVMRTVKNFQVHMNENCRFRESFVHRNCHHRCLPWLSAWGDECLYHGKGIYCYRAIWGEAWENVTPSMIRDSRVKRIIRSHNCEEQ